MNRGDVIVIRQQGTPSSKARPCVIVQRDSALSATSKVTVCPLTSQLRGVGSQRPFVVPSAINGLRHPSEVQVDWIYTHPVNNVGPVIGRLDRAAMEQVDVALRRWLDV